MPSSNTQTFSLFFSTGSGDDASIQQVPVIGLSPGSPIVDFQGNPDPEIRDITLDPANGVYFLSVDAGSNNGTNSSSIVEEHFGQTPTFTANSTLVTDSGPGAIVAIGDDSADQTLFYIDGTQGNAVYRMGYGADATSQVQVATLPASLNSELFYGPMAYDQQDHVGYFAAASGGYTITTSQNGGGFTTKSNFTGNYIYKVSGLTKDANSASTHISQITVPVADGIVQSLSYDSANQTLYFLTQAFGPNTSEFGLYAFNPSNNAITPLWQLPENSISYLQNSEVLTVDPATGDYFISTEHGGIYEGNVGNIANPTPSIRTNNVGDGQGSPTALAVDDGATVSSVTVAAIDGNTADTTGQIQPGDSITIDVTFDEQVTTQGLLALDLNNGAEASYVSGSGTDQLVFRYAPGLYQNDASLAVTGLTGTVTNIAGTAFNGASVSATFNVSVDTTPPSLGVSYTFNDAVQGGPPILVLQSTPDIIDMYGDGILTSAKVVLSDAQAGDELGINGDTGGSLDGGAIEYSYGNGTLSLTGDATLSEYASALAGVTYQDTGTDTSNNGHPGRTVDMSITEGSLTSTLVEFQLTIDRVPEIASGGYQAEVVEGATATGGAGAALAGDTDPDNDTLTVAQVQGSTAGSVVGGNYGVLVLDADGSYSYLASKTANIDAAPAGPVTDNFVFTVSDGNGGTATETFTIAIDRPPALSESTTVNYASGSAPVTIDPGLILADPDGDVITGATIDIGSGLLAGDVLDFATQNGIAGVYDSADGLLTLTGDASATNYQAALRSIQFASSAPDATQGGADPSRTIDFNVTELSASGASIASNLLATQIDVTPTPACYVTGTRILTTNGEVPVESLNIGDQVITASGTPRPVKWIGHRAYAAHFANANPHLLPITFKAGALGNNLPRRDLHVSPKHAMFLDNALIPAECLVNAVTILKTTRTGAPLAYWHIELDTHDVLLAEGAPAESFVDDDSRGMFHNAQEYWAAHPNDVGREAIYCAPRIEDGYELAAIRARLAHIAGLGGQSDEYGTLSGHFTVEAGVVSGWARNELYPSAPVCLDILVHGTRVRQTLANRVLPDVAGGPHGFEVKLRRYPAVEWR